jgi:hypothetical protein
MRRRGSEQPPDGSSEQANGSRVRVRTRLVIRSCAAPIGPLGAAQPCSSSRTRINLKKREGRDANAVIDLPQKSQPRPGIDAPGQAFVVRPCSRFARRTRSSAHRESPEEQPRRTTNSLHIRLGVQRSEHFSDGCHEVSPRVEPVWRHGHKLTIGRRRRTCEMWREGLDSNPRLAVWGPDRVRF